MADALGTTGHTWPVTSIRMRIAAAYVHRNYQPTIASADAMRLAFDEPKQPAPPPRALTARHEVTSRDVDGFTCFTVSPRREATGAVIYLHGGAYVGPIDKHHWNFIGTLADAGLRIEVPMYGLVPQHTYREAYAFVHEVYAQLITQAAPSSITLAGDSAGGGLALGFAEDLRDRDMPLPRRLLLLAPWVDATLSADPAVYAATRDPWLGRDGLVEAGLAWADGDDPRDPRISPLYGGLHGLPPTDVYIGTRDLFHADMARLAERAGRAQWDLRLHESRGSVHVYPLLPTPEGRRARKQIVARLLA